MLIAGIDEAGRGCVIGPLVVAGICVQSENLHQLSDLGVKDSKLLSPKKREEMYPEIIKIAHSYHVVKILPYIIDRFVRSNRKLYKLNRLEAQTMAGVIQVLNPNMVYVDAADVLQERFGLHIKECLRTQVNVIAEHKADETYPIVSAASIIAKVERDREIENLKVKYGEFGSGYLTDDKTYCFLKKLLNENGGIYPSCVRTSWKPAKQAKSEHRTQQKTLA